MLDRGANKPFTGGCHCGANRYTIPATAKAFEIPEFASFKSPEPRFPDFVCHCHCRDCRLSVGSLSVAQVCNRTDAFTWTKREALKDYQSSPNVKRSFCSNCGTSLTYQANGEDWMTFLIGTLDKPGRVDAKSHTHGESMIQTFERSDAHLPVYDGNYAKVFDGCLKNELPPTNAQIVKSIKA
ncbi:hypothetical protein HDU86_001964 [Geranomyces michiganensis]|nr:hypothetical protein HDU86_001964 [Geranomyces michiganensis]